MDIYRYLYVHFNAKLLKNQIMCKKIFNFSNLKFYRDEF